MAELVKNDKGFKVIKLSVEEASKLGWGISGSGACICMHCNNLRSPEASINDFFRKCENYFGFRPYIVAIDIINPRYSSYYYNDLSRGSEKFSGIDNLMYIPSNPAMIEQFLTNFKDMDIFDVYTPLQSIYRSNRYELVRKNTL